MINIHLCGDIMIGRSFNDTFKYEPAFNIWTNTIDIFKKSDFTLGNLECTITDSTEKWPNKVFNYKLDPKYKYILKRPNFKHLNIANNHILDYNIVGMKDTMRNLDLVNIKWSGAGLNKDMANGPVIHNIKGTMIGIISFADHYDYWAAIRNKPGINYVNISEDYSHILEHIKKIKSECDILIFSIHHGPNYVDEVPMRTKEFFHDLLSAGTDIIHGHSAHHVLPIEKIGGVGNKYIFYSFGDFIDDYAVDPTYRNDLSFIAGLQIENKKIIKLNVYPTKIIIDREQEYMKPYVRLLNKEEADYNNVISRLKINKIMIGSSRINKKYKLVYS